jgi:hypothetical protein
MPKFKPNTGFRMESPLKTKLGRWLMGRKKQTLDDGTEVITDRRGNVVKAKTADGTKTKYKRGNRPSELYTKYGQRLY